MFAGFKNFKYDHHGFVHEVVLPLRIYNSKVILNVIEHQYVRWL